MKEALLHDGPASTHVSVSPDEPPSDGALLDSILQQADTYYANENWRAARDSLRLAASLAPSNPQVLDALGSLHFHLKEYRESCAAFMSAVRQNPDSPDLHMRLALCHGQLNQPKEAEFRLRRALALRPDDLTALKLLADCYLDQQLPHDAALIYGKLIDRHPDQIGVLLALAKCFFCLGDAEGAQAAFDQVLAIDPANEIARENRALLQKSAAPAPAQRVLAPQRVYSAAGCDSDTAEAQPVAVPGSTAQPSGLDAPETIPGPADAAVSSTVPGTINPSRSDLEMFYANAAVEFGEVEPPQLDEFHLQHSRLLPSREHILPFMPTGGICAEVGTQTGEFAKHILAVLQPAKLHLYDIDFSLFDYAGFQPAIQQGMLELHQGDSSSLLAMMPDRHFDFIYIDGDHSYAGVMRDLKQAERKIKAGGWIVCNDYTLYSPLEKAQYGVYRAVNEFCWAHGFEIVYLGLHQWSYHDVALRRMPPEVFAAVSAGRQQRQIRRLPGFPSNTEPAGMPSSDPGRSRTDHLSREKMTDQPESNSPMNTQIQSQPTGETSSGQTKPPGPQLPGQMGNGTQPGGFARQPRGGRIAVESGPETAAKGDDRFARFRFQSPLKARLSYEQIKQRKVDLIAGFGQAKSIRDFGGLWGVFGKYLLEGAQALQCQYAEMVDVNPRPEFEEKIAQLHRVMPLEVKMTQGDFRDGRIFQAMMPVEVALLYEVLLHQDNAVEVIRNVIGKTTRCICVAQPVLKEELFALPGGAVNLQFYPEELKDQLRYAGWWQKEPTTDEFTPALWMWGQTTSHLISIFHGYGWKPTSLETHEASEYWNYALIRFEPRVRT